MLSQRSLTGTGGGAPMWFRWRPVASLVKISKRILPLFACYPVRGQGPEEVFDQGIVLSSRKEPHLVVDVFAGPGGLGEGFLAHRDTRETRFKSALSIEREDSAHETLTLRHFLRAFPDDEFREGYYDYLADKLTLDELYAAHPDERSSAKASARKIALGADSHVEVKRLLGKKLRGQARWPLVGGPPCQAYLSSVARAGSTIPNSPTTRSTSSTKNT